MVPYHVPVMLTESIEGMNIVPGGVYVDATFGGGGHSSFILKNLDDKGRLVAFDQDPDALRNVPEDERIIFVQHNFRFLQRFLRLHGIKQVDGILADLGVSSHQFDEGERGFSYRYDTLLDMRMNQKSEKTAADILNSYSAEQLQDIFSRYGELRNAKSLAVAIAASRQRQEIKTVGSFLAIVDPFARGNKARYLSQLFQAIRIEVNDEMGALTDFLIQTLEVLKPGGRLVVIAYHSIEDRLVKKFLKTGNAKGVVEKDFYGNIHRPFKLISKKALVPGEEEVGNNPRARSAKLRVAEKI